MTVQRFRLVESWLDTARRVRTWKLVDERGRIRAEMTCKDDAALVIEALILADTLTANSMKVGIIPPESISRHDERYITD